MASINKSPVLKELPGWPVKTGGPVYSSPAVADIERNGTQKVVIGSDDNNVYVLNADGTNMPGFPFKTGAKVRASASIADLDKNNNLAIAIGSSDTKFYVLNSNGTIRSGWPFRTEEGIDHIAAIGDINGDGALEIIFTSSELIAYQAYFSINCVGKNGDTLFQDLYYHDAPSAQNLRISAPVLVDITSDNLLEVVYTMSDGGYGWGSYLRANDKTGKRIFSRRYDESVALPFTTSVAAGDANSDGETELIAGQFSRIRMMDVLGNTISGFPMQFPGYPEKGEIIVADVDSNGEYEIVFGSNDGNLYAFRTYNQYWVTGFPFKTGGPIKSSPAMGDINNDKKPDVVFASTDGKLYAVDGQGVLLDGFPFDLGSPVDSSAPAIADINGDGLLDIIVGTMDGNIHAVGTEGKCEPYAAPWPKHRYDLANTGFYPPKFVPGPGPDTRNIFPQLYGGFPNPFSSATEIKYYVGEKAGVRFDFYNLLGIKVRTVFADHNEKGDYSVIWDGKRDDGSLLPSGMYPFNMSTNGFQLEGKSVIVR